MTLDQVLGSLALVVLLVGGYWFLVCNQRTASERKRLGRAVFESDGSVWTYQTYMEDLHSVDYNEHLLNRLMLHDPFAPYPKRLLDLMREHEEMVALGVHIDRLRRPTLH